MNKILLWGRIDDEPLSQVYDWLLHYQVDVDFLDYAEIDQYSAEVDIGHTISYAVKSGERTFTLNHYTAAYLRPFDITDVVSSAGEQTRHRNITHHIINTWAERLCQRAINCPSAEGSNHSKLFQFSYIRRAGFLTADSIVSNHKPAITEFLQTHCKCIYKSMSSVRSIVQELNESDYADKDLGPCLIQKLLAGSNIRVHVVGQQCFACLIESESVDYRYGQSNIHPYQLPKDIVSGCIQLSASLGLPLSGIDLIRTADEKWYCLEVNPNPGFTYFVEEGNYAIAQAVAKWLMQRG